jgi:uncharacterized protein YecT (DUF1311 family)
MIIAMLATAAMSPSYNHCLNSGDAANGVQIAMDQCASTELAVQDGRLNQAYVMRMNSLDQRRKLILRGMQRQWIADRDRRCAVRRGGGSLASFTAADCRITVTRQRIAFLERYR